MKVFILMLTVFVICDCAIIQLDCNQFHQVQSCGNLMQAKKCGFVTECIETVWKNQPRTEEGGEVCQFCETVVTEARAQFDNETLDMVRSYLESICSMCPETEVASECKSLVDEYTPEIFQMIRAELDPQTVCTAMGLCPGFTKIQPDIEDNLAKTVLLRGAPLLSGIDVPVEPVETVVPVETAPSTNNKLCDDCKQFITDLEAIVTNATTEKEIEDYLEQMCAGFGSYEAMCKTLVEQYTPQIIDMLKAELDPEMICETIELCPGKLNHLTLIKLALKKSPLYVAAHSSAHSDEECEVCKFVMTEIQQMDQSATVQDEIKNFLKKEVCAHLGSYKDECDQSIDAYATMIFELLASELDPETRCRSLGFCPATQSPSATRLATPLLPPVSAPVAGPSSTCIMCEFVMTKLEKMLTVNSTEQEILSALDRVCSYFPDTIAKSCENFVDTYGPAIITLLTSEITPEEICQELGLCQTVTVHRVPAMELVAGEVKTGLHGEEGCAVCKTVIQYVDSLLQENYTTELVEHTLLKVCNYMPESFKADCTDFVDTYGPVVIQILVSEAAPEVVCNALGLCTSGDNNSVAMTNLIEAHSAPKVGSHHCTWGPDYWCASEDNARECGAEAHCQRVGAFPKN